MGLNSDEMPGEDAREDWNDLALDPESDVGVRLYNEILDEGSANISAVGYPSQDLEMCTEDAPVEYLDPELYDPDEETLPPGEIELIFENCYLM